MDTKQEYVTLLVSDGSLMQAYVAQPASGQPSAGIIILQEGFGVNAHIREVTERFAAQGYLAVAPELFHRTVTGFEGSYTDFEPVMKHVNAITTEGLQKDIRATFDALKIQGGIKPFPVAVIGYCLGGRAAYVAAATVPVDCAISYYGGGIAPSDRSSGLLDLIPNIHAPLLLCWAGLDKHIGTDQTAAVTQALRAAGKSFVNIEFSDADHGFFCNARASYNAAAAEQAWGLTLAFLKSNLAKLA